MAWVQTDLRRRILGAFVCRGLIGQADAKEMLAYPHSGFSVVAGVCIEANNRAAPNEINSSTTTFSCPRTFIFHLIVLSNFAFL
jgi:hypothetical protein